MKSTTKILFIVFLVVGVFATSFPYVPEVKAVAVGVVPGPYGATFGSIRRCTCSTGRQVFMNLIPSQISIPLWITSGSRKLTRGRLTTSNHVLGHWSFFPPLCFKISHWGCDVLFTWGKVIQYGPAEPPKDFSGVGI